MTTTWFLSVTSWRVLLLHKLPMRLYELVDDVLLVFCAVSCYMGICHVLSRISWTAHIADLLLDRSDLHSGLRIQNQLFFESRAAGASATFVWTFRSDLLVSYLHRLQMRLNLQQRSGIRSMMWLKLALSYTVVGSIISETGTKLHGYVFKEKNEEKKLQPTWAVDQLTVNYLLRILLGAALIIASKLMLLCIPTRQVGLALQGRVIRARKYWELHPMHSLLKATGTFSVTVFCYCMSKDMLLSLQLGTFCGILLLLRSKLSALAIRRHFVSPPSLQKFTKMLAELHWVKLVTVVVMVLCFSFQVYAAIVHAANAPSNSSVFMLSFLVMAAVAHSILALFGRKLSWMELVRCGRQFAAKICVSLIALIAPQVSHGLPGVVFSCLLSAFCIAFSRECWDDIEVNEEGHLQVVTDADRSPEAANIWLTVTMDADSPSSDPPPWYVQGLSVVKDRYPHFHKRVKWAFMGVMVVSICDVCSTGIAMINCSKAVLSLSQYSAINVVVSASVGYLTSPSPYELHPAVLLHTGLKQFKNKWIILPLQMFVETLVFIAVFVGTFAASSTVFSSFTLAALSGVVVSVGGHSACSRLHLTVGNCMHMQQTATCALLFYSFFIIYASMVSLLCIYHYFNSIEAAFCLASLAGIFFLAASELLLMWEPTREVGLLLQRRVTHAKENWQLEPLRSFVEVFTWFAVICGSFAMYDDLLLALQLGTFSGIAVTLSGELFRKKRSKLIPWGQSLLADGDAITAPISLLEAPCCNLNEPDCARPLPAMLLFAYIGSGTFQWIFENMRSLEVTVLLATIAGIAFLCFADMLVLFKPTRWAGVILQDRFINVKHNWYVYPVRSFVEFGCFMGVIYGSYAIYHDLVVAVQVGTLSGMLVTLGGEQVRSCARALPMNESKKIEVEKTQILPLPVMSLLGLVGAVAFNIIYTHLHSIEVAFVLATTSGIIFALVGDMFVIWKPTRKFGTTIGIVMCVCGELAMEFVAEAERCLIAKDASARLVHNSQKDSIFLSLPYEIQFEVAYFLTAEDLLVARATCHKINNMLKAESARFWLHASLRRTFRDRSVWRGCSRAPSISHRMGNRARSLVYEAVTLMLPKIVGARDPAQVLTSSNEVSRALKWVYLNAEWIRNQNLPPLMEEGETKDVTLISLAAGDIAFNVFRHMPDKSSLGIIVSRDENFAIERVEVPKGIYDTIQRDPLSFVAAETLSTLEVFSNWHHTVVAFATMTLIFIGQFSSDLLCAYVLHSGE
ncbi:unnamed protein product [Peronospora belbahrii]|uniref:F-box domain-containing protein n=1 Tax=Peronospora belbahrii TaxID=622444 RepID=A0ABN8DB89_9STRA|nr:unnamed protein product [Peronospora belbahrii]